MIGPCAICRREIVAGFGYSPERTKPIVWTCSPRCCDIAAIHYGKETSMTEHEEAARRMAGAAGGDYLDTIGHTDLSTLDAEEWKTFLDRIFETYHVSLIDLSGANQPPF